MLCHSLNPISLKLSPIRLLQGAALCVHSQEVTARKLRLSENQHSNPFLIVRLPYLQNSNITFRLTPPPSVPKGNSYSNIDDSFWTRSFRPLTGFVALDFGEKFVRQQKIPALHRHQQVLFFPHDGREPQNSVQTCAFCPAGDPSGARFPIFHREPLNPGHESAPSSGELSGMGSCGRSAELSQSLARVPLHCSPAGCGSPVPGLQLQSDWKRLRCESA